MVLIALCVFFSTCRCSVHWFLRSSLHLLSESAFGGRMFISDSRLDLQFQNYSAVICTTVLVTANALDLALGLLQRRNKSICCHLPLPTITIPT